jgi:hypothetical protein
MPQRCHICGADGDGTHFMPDAKVGYTKLMCSECCRRYLLHGSDDEDDDEASNVYSSGGAAPQPAASSSAPASGSNPHSPSMSFQVGCRVRVTGLVSNKQHNGKVGKVCRAIDAETGRLGVDLDEGVAHTLNTKACNLVAISPAPASLSDSAVTHPSSSSSASTPSSGALPIPPSSPLSRLSLSHDPPAPAPFASWVSAARAQSLSLKGSPLSLFSASARCSLQCSCPSHTPTPLPQICSTASPFPTPKAYSSFKPAILALPQQRACKSNSRARIIYATVFRSGLIPQTPPLSSPLQHRPPASCGC